MRYDFVSDNAAAMAPEAVDALIRANAGFAKSYGADEVTARAAEEVRRRFDADAEVRFVMSGTAANAVALSMLARPFESVLAYDEAHIRTDVAGAPGFVGQGVGLVGLPGPSGKISEAALEARLAEDEPSHRQPAAALSLTQARALPNVSAAPVLMQPLSSTSRVMMIRLTSTDMSAIDMSVVWINVRAVCARWARANASGPAPTSAVRTRVNCRLE